MSPTITRREFLRQSAAGAAVVAVLPAVPTALFAAPADEFTGLDALAQAELVRTRQVTPRELVEAAIRRIEAVNPQINAVIRPMFDEALALADGPLPDGPFRGVPWLLKDIVPQKGVPSTFGSRFFKDFRPPASHEMVNRHAKAGLVMVGKTNTPEFGFLPTTEPYLFGPTKNPWNTAHSPGGSSGGSGAAVAAGILPMAHATDGGGSIRVPASCNGVFGLKVSRGRNPAAPAPRWQALSVQHCVSRTVRDSAALLDATHGAVPGGPWHAPAPARPYLQEVGATPGRLKIAFATTDMYGRPAHPECVAAVQQTAKLCEELGHHVEEAKPDIAGKPFEDAFMALWTSMADAVVKSAAQQLGGAPGPEHFEPFTLSLAERGAKLRVIDITVAWSTLHKASYTLATFLEGYDLLLTPVLGQPPLRTGELHPGLTLEDALEPALRYVAYTPIANTSGNPAMSVPLHWTPEQLPVGSHFIGRFGDEATLFRLAAQLEAAQPWADRRPAVHAAA